MTEIAGRAAVVTGAGSGIGRGLAVTLAKEGAKVVVADIMKANAEAVAASIKKAGGSAIAVSCDVSDRASVQQMKAEANKAFGHVSLVFANAGVTNFELLAEISDQHLDWVMQVDLMGVMHTLRAFLPEMVAARDGHVVATSSMAGMLPAWIPWHAIYASAKMGILGLMLGARHELAEAGIGSTVYCPGGVQGSMKENNMKYRPAKFGGPLDEELKFPQAFFQGSGQVNFLQPEEAAPMVMLAVKRNRAIVMDHSEHRSKYMDTYHNYVMEAFDDAADYERAVLKAKS